MKSLPEAEKYLNDGVTFEKPDKTDIRHTDNEMVRIAHEERIRMFDKILSVA
ncbi:MAG: hypothetical protein PF545_03855 [Elusimicrobia bacterium]|nr:hypothetical protein [Elusimicrobiota bacterium]